MDNQLQIKWLERKVSALSILLGIKQLQKKQADFSSVEIKGNVLDNTFKNLGISQLGLDVNYYTTSWDNWQQILSTVTDIVSGLPWISEKADCDNRAEFVSSFVSITFYLNTCAKCYCEVYDTVTGKFKFLHWVNLIVDESGNAYIFDVDYGCRSQKVTSNNLVMGDNKYKFISCRIG